LQGLVKGKRIKLGSASFVEVEEDSSLQTRVFVSIDNYIKGKFILENSYRNDLDLVFEKLKGNYSLGILSGDNQGEKSNLQRLLPQNASLIFNQQPENKLNYIKGLQDQGKKVLMIGDGLNDAGALKQSDVGLVIAEDINVFSPASDGIIDAIKFSQLPRLLDLSKRSLKVIKISFVISLLYNLIGMYFAITGQLLPIIAAILMPLSSITVVIFVTIATNFISYKKSIEHDKCHSFKKSINLNL